MGVVEKVGPNVKDIKPGDRVVASFQISCGTCRFCSQRLSSMCQRTNSSSVENTMYGSRTAGILGYSHLTGGYAGGQAEYVRQAFADVNLLKVPHDLSDEQVLYLSDVLPTSYHCVVDTGVYEGDTVGVWGVGPIGLMVCKFAFLKGAKRVIAVDSVGWRLDYAKKHMPDLEVINYSTAKGNVVDEIKKKCPEGLDLALECAAGEYAKGILHKIETAIGAETDTSEILNEMIASVRPFGRVGVTGVYAELHEPLQHRGGHADGHQIHRERAGARAEVLGGAAERLHHPRKGGPADDGQPPRRPERDGGAIQALRRQEGGRRLDEGVRADQALVAPREGCASSD